MKCKLSKKLYRNGRFFFHNYQQNERQTNDINCAQIGKWAGNNTAQPVTVDVIFTAVTIGGRFPQTPALKHVIRRPLHGLHRGTGEYLPHF